MKEYSRINFRTSYSIVLSFLVTGLLILVSWMYFKTYHLILLILGLLLLLAMLLWIYTGLKSKIIITDQEIISKTPLKIRKLNYKNIKKIGVYGASSNYIYDIEKPKHHKWTFLEQKFIYLTTDPDLKPYFFKKPKEFIDFHYRKEIYDFIEKKINAST
jgi:hypothetical protein